MQALKNSMQWTHIVSIVLHVNASFEEWVCVCVRVCVHVHICGYVNKVVYKMNYVVAFWVFLFVFCVYCCFHVFIMHL